VKLKKGCAFAVLIFAGATFGGFLSSHLWPIDSSAMAAMRRQKTVTAERFVMIDSGGKQRGTLQVSESGMATLALTDASGMDRVELRVAAEGSAGLGLFDRTGHELAVFGAGADGHSGVRIFGPQGKQVAALGSLSTGETALTLTTLTRAEHAPGWESPPKASLLSYCLTKAARTARS
jgi:hypothetical protein